MGLITQAATYRGFPTDWGVSETKNGFPQFVVSLQAQEVWDAETSEWYGIDEGENPEITAYLVLFDGKGQATLNCDQVKKVFGWSGNSFAELNDGQYAETPVQFRVEESEYEGKAQLKVNWIDEYDAVPGRAVKKLDSAGLKNLDQKWAKMLSGGKVKAAKAPAAKPKAAAPEPPAAAPEPPAAAPKPPAAAPEPPAATPPKKIKPMSKQLAWEYTVEGTADYDDGLRAEEWTKAIEAICPGKTTDKDISPQEWGRIAEATVAAVNKFKF